MGLLSKIFGNTRKPEGFFGRLMVSGMNGGSHAAMAKWGLEKTDIPQTGEILDIGCGGRGPTPPGGTCSAGTPSGSHSWAPPSPPGAFSTHSIR